MRYEVGYTLEAVDLTTWKPIVHLRLPPDTARRIMDRAWPGEDFWTAPGGSTARIETPAQAAAITEVLGGEVTVQLDPKRLRWLFHAHLIEAPSRERRG